MLICKLPLTNDPQEVADTEDTEVLTSCDRLFDLCKSPAEVIRSLSNLLPLLAPALPAKRYISL